MELPPDLAETIARIERLRPDLRDTRAKATSESWETTYRTAREEGIRRWVAAIPPASAGATLEALEVDEFNRDAIRLCRHYIGRLRSALATGYGIAIHGPKGTGKTTLAWALARAIVEAPEAGPVAGPNGKWRTFQGAGLEPVNRVEVHSWIDLAEAERADWKRETRTRPVTRAELPPFLVLDDIGRPGTLDEVSQGLLFRLVDARYRARRPTIVTSNVPLDPMGDGPLDGPIVDRLTERGRSFVLALLGPSRRQKRNET